MTTSEVQKLLGVSSSTVNNMVHDGRLKATITKDRYRRRNTFDVDEESVMKLKESNKVNGYYNSMTINDAVIHFPDSLKEYIKKNVKVRFKSRSQITRMIFNSYDLKVSDKTVANDLTKMYAPESRVKIYEEFFKNYGYSPDTVIDNGEEKIILKTIKEPMTIEEMTEVMNEEDLYHFVHNLNSSQLAYFNCLLNIPFFYNQEKKKYGDS